MNTVEDVVALFGGQTALAKHLGLQQTAISYWVKVGVIPSKWHGRLLYLAKQQGVTLLASDLIPKPSIDFNLISPPEPPKVVSSNASKTSDADNPDEVDEDHKDLPLAKYRGFVSIGKTEVPVYVLSDGQRVISRVGATAILTETQNNGNLENYIQVQSLIKYMPINLAGLMIDFRLEHIVNRSAKGMAADTFIEICMAYVNAFRDGALETERQKQIAMQAAIVLASCAKTGLDALIDEATGYQYVRDEKALQVRVNLYLADEMRKWEKTFPDTLWEQFGRLTNWQGQANQRPKYWGKLVTELVYEYLDPDVARWLKDNAPKPVHGKNYHQWLSEQYGLKALMEHIWMLIGMASACSSMGELRRRMAEKHGKIPVQLTFFVPSDSIGTPTRKRRAKDT